MIETPVALIIFRRPSVTRQVLSALRQARVRRLFVIADGPRNGHETDQRLVSETRDLISRIDWDCDVIRIYSETNLGLRQRVLSGLDEVFNQVDRALILEDDCLPHQDFFRFATELLDRFEQNPEVGVISANNFAPMPQASESYYFSTHVNIWGWATWSRTWEEFRRVSPHLPLSDELKQTIRSRLPGLGRSRSFLGMTDKAAQLDSWAIQFAVSCHLNEKLAVVPKVNLAKNIGFGPDSTHTKFESYADEVDVQSLAFPLVHPHEISPSFQEMRRESRFKVRRWIFFPLLHPLHFLVRVFRFIGLFANGSRIS